MNATEVYEMMVIEDQIRVINNRYTAGPVGWDANTVDDLRCRQRELILRSGRTTEWIVP